VPSCRRNLTSPLPGVAFLPSRCGSKDALSFMVYVQEAASFVPREGIYVKGRGDVRLCRNFLGLCVL
jgi:hypothetical protein